MTKEEIEQAREVIETPVTAENVDRPIVAVFPKDPVNYQIYSPESAEETK